MVAENNKNSNSNESDTGRVVKVGDGGSSGGSRKLHLAASRGRKKTTIVVAVVLAIVVALAILSLTGVIHIGQKVYGEAAGHKIYKKDLEAFQASTGVSDKQATIVLADKYLTQAMAQQHGVKVTSADILAEGCPTQKANPYGYQNCVNNVYFSKLAANNEGVYQGKLLVANFSHNLPYQSPLLSEQKMLNPSLGNPAAIAADKAYALSFITNLYNQIQSGKITFDQAIQMERADPHVGQQAYPTQSHSGPFDNRLSQINLLAAGSIRQKVESIKPGTLTKPFAVPVSASMYNKSTQDSYYLVVQMDKVTGGNTHLSFPDEVKQAKKQLGYKVNV